MWNDTKSLKLSKACVLLFALLGGAVVLCLPLAAKWLISFSRAELKNSFVYLLITGYTLSVPCFAALFFLWRLLRNISDNFVFISENTKYLRYISWCCILAAIICVISTAYYVLFIVLAAVTAFIGLILRVLKNIFAEAVRIKQENDFTI